MKPKLFISLQIIYDQGGISTSIKNLLNEIHHQYDITLCAVGCYISDKASIPNDVTIIGGSPWIRDTIINRKFLKDQSLFTHVRRNVRRLIRRVMGTHYIIERGLSEVQLPDVEYDAAIAFSNDKYSNGRIGVGGVYDLITQRVKAKRKVAWMHNDLSQEGYDRNIALRAFKDFDAIVSVSYHNKSLLDKMVPEYNDKSFVVYNMYNLRHIINSSVAHNPYKDNGKLHLVTVARLELKQKRQDRIVRACGKLKREGYKGFDWCLVGDGVDREALERMADEQDVRDIITFAGLQTNPYPYISHADAFVLTSLYEGYGMVVKEAQILGVPTFVTNFGPAHEVVKDGEEGLICENSMEGVYTMIKQLLSHREELDMYGQCLKKNPVDNSLALKQFDGVCLSGIQSDR